jgi:hypothetical protein
MDESLKKELRVFLQEHPEGWSHDDWLRLLFHLSEAGYDTVDEDGIGLALERERLARSLDELGVKGLGPRRIEAVVEHFDTLWNLKAASPETVAETPGVPKTVARELAERIQSG